MGGTRKTSARTEGSKKSEGNKINLVSYTTSESGDDDPTPDKTIRDERNTESNYEGPTKSVEKPPAPKKDHELVESDWEEDSEEPANELTDNEADEQPSRPNSPDLYDKPILVDRYGRKQTAMSEQLDSLDKMFQDINEKANFYSDHTFQFPFLNQDFWNDFRVIKLGSLFSFKLHFHELYDLWEQVLRKKNTKYSNSTYFYWPAEDTHKFLKDALIPLGKRFRFETVEQILGKRKHLEEEMDKAFNHPATVYSPDGGICLRPFTYEKNPDVLYVKWFQKSQRPVTLTNKKNKEFTWNGYTMVTNLTDYFMLLTQIKEMDKLYCNVTGKERKEDEDEHGKRAAKRKLQETDPRNQKKNK